MTDFCQYTDAVLSALKNSNRDQEIISKKVDILNGIYEFYNLVPETVLFVGFNPAILGTKTKNICITEISDSARDYLDSKRISYTYINESGVKMTLIPEKWITTDVFEFIMEEVA